MFSHYLFFIVVIKIKHKFYRTNIFWIIILINNKLRQSLTIFSRRFGIILIQLRYKITNFFCPFCPKGRRF